MSRKELRINPAICNGCGACRGACPFTALQMQGGVAYPTEACVLCGACVNACTRGAISLTTLAEPSADLSDWRGVWVVAEQIDGVVQPVTLELVAEGRRLADELDAALHVFCMGYCLDKVGRELLNYGVDSVLLADDPALAIYAAAPYARVLAEAIAKHRPEVVLAGASAIGRAYLGRAAVLAETGLTADCTALAITPQRQLLQTRPAFGGNVMASILCARHRPQMATVRHKVFAEATRQAPRGQIETFSLDPAWLVNRTQRVDFIPESDTTAPLHEADIIVAGGHGMQDAAGFVLLEDLAKALGGAVAASRSAVDAGWYPYSHQVGQTGKTVAPQLYFACGISGAVQHQVGMRGADRIVAINSDPHAPIFEIADYGIVGDVREIIPSLLDGLSGGE